MNIFELIIYIMGALADIAFFAFMQGRARRLYTQTKKDTVPPWFIGAVLCPAWFLIAAGGGMYLFFKYFSGLGDKRGMVLNEIIHDAKQTNARLQATNDRILRQIAAGGFDLDDQLGLKAITRRSVQEEMDEHFPVPQVLRKGESVHDHG